MSWLKKALWWAAGWCIGLSTFVMLTLGLGLIRNHLGTAEHGSFADRHPTTTTAMGWLLLAVATLILTTTMTAKDGVPSRWVKALPGLLALAAINGLMMLSSGHLLNTPSKPISRVYALTLTLLFVGSAIFLSSILKGRILRLPDRVALLAFPFSVAWSVLDDSATGLAVGFCCLVIAWVFDHVQRRRRFDHGSRQLAG